MSVWDQFLCKVCSHISFVFPLHVQTWSLYSWVLIMEERLDNGSPEVMESLSQCLRCYLTFSEMLTSPSANHFRWFLSLATETIPN